MGKTCIAAIGLGLAGAIIGMHIYMFSGSDEHCEIKKEFKDAAEDLKKAVNNLTDMGKMEA